MINETRIKPIRTSQELEAVFECAKQDEHNLVGPSHMILHGQEIIGSLSIAPSVFVWADTKKSTMRTSLVARAFYEDHLSAGGARMVVVPCLGDSPFFKFMEKDNYINLGVYHLFAKAI